MRLGEWIARNFRELLEKKHLYQNYNLDQGTIDAEIEKEIVEAPKEMAEELRGLYRNILDRGWNIMGKPQPMAQAIPNDDKLLSQLPVIFILPTMKVYCSTCNRQEAFNPVFAESLLEKAWVDYELKEVPAHDGEKSSPGKTVQVFALGFQCQSCKGLSEFFLIRREGLKLMLHGRSPMEHVVVPSFIPRSVRQYYGRAIVAFQSGETLAAIFLLRVLIEQYARDKSNDKDSKVEPLIDEYMAGLPDDFKARFPSLREYWEKLSIAIHTANESEELFQEACSKIERHFDAKRLFEIGD